MSADFDPKDLLEIPDPYAAEARKGAGAAKVDALPVAPTRAETRRLRFGAIGAALAFEVMLIAMMSTRHGATLSPALLAYGVVLPLLVAVFALWVLQAPLSPRARVVSSIVVGAVVFVATTLLSDAPGDTSPGAMVRCVMGGSLMAAGPLLLAVYSMRHSFVVGVTWRTAALGLACGLVGAAATRLYCPIDAAVHVLLGHGVPIALAMLAAVLLGRRVTRA
jgi:hypothetical protein